MEAPLTHKEQESRSVSERFNEFFKNGEIKEISIDEVPPHVRERFEGYSCKYILHEDYVPNNFSGVYLLTHENGDETYIAEQIKVYEKSIGTIEQLSYYIEMRGDTEIGHGEMRKDIGVAPIFDGNPFIGFTGTEEDFRHQRLGERRLNAMNTFAQVRYGKPLYSGDTVSPEARGMFEKYAKEGKVEIVEDPTGKKKPTYRMLPISPEQDEE